MSACIQHNQKKDKIGWVFNRWSLCEIAKLLLCVFYTIFKPGLKKIFISLILRVCTYFVHELKTATLNVLGLASFKFCFTWWQISNSAIVDTVAFCWIYRLTFVVKAWIKTKNTLHWQDKAFHKKVECVFIFGTNVKQKTKSSFGNH